jgi:hypothetical protein
MRELAQWQQLHVPAGYAAALTAHDARQQPGSSEAIGEVVAQDQAGFVTERPCTSTARAPGRVPGGAGSVLSSPCAWMQSSAGRRPGRSLLHAGRRAPSRA